MDPDTTLRFRPVDYPDHRVRRITLSLTGPYL